MRHPLLLPRLLTTATIAAGALTALAAWQPLPAARNLILMIPGGASHALVALARFYGGQPLTLDAILSGAAQAANSADAAQATAALTTAGPSGGRTAGSSGFMPPTIMEAASRQGRAVGIISTSKPDAPTLAPLLANSRRFEFIICDSIATTNAGRPKLTAFADSTPVPQADVADTNPGQPTLAATVASAISRLRSGKNGFVLVVETAIIADCCRNHDTFGAVSELLAFDRAVAAAMALAVQDRQTLLVVTPGYEAGGLTLPFPADSSSLLPDTWLAQLRQMRLSAAGLERKLAGDHSAATIAAHMRAWWGVRPGSATLARIEALISNDGHTAAYAMGDAFSTDHLRVSWSSPGYVAADLPLWSYGPGRPHGSMHTTGIALAMASAMGMDYLRQQAPPTP